MKYNIFVCQPIINAHRLLSVLEKSPDPMTAQLAHDARMELWACIAKAPVDVPEFKKLLDAIGLQPSTRKSTAAA